MKIQCNQCLAMTDLPPGADPHASTWCDCCTIRDDSGEIHHHGRAAESCPGNNGIGHPGEPCDHPNPAVCAMVSRPMRPGEVSANPAAPVREHGEPCPGGHCGAGVSGCAVCRPVTHFPVTGERLAMTGG